MNLDAYHKAWMQGFSEQECCRIAEDVWEQDMHHYYMEEKAHEEHLNREHQKYLEELHKEYLEELENEDSHTHKQS